MKKARSAKILIFAAFAAFTLLAYRLCGFDASYFWQRRSHLGDIAAKMLPVDKSYFSSLGNALAITVRMAVAGSGVGSILALAAAPYCTSGLGSSAFLRRFLRAVIQILRSFPALITALVATFIFGLGSFSGFLAIAVYTFAVVARLTYEDAENAEAKSYRALRSGGAGHFVSFFRAIFPEISGSYLTNVLYLLETNIRHSSVLGYVGAGGIGLLLNEKISWREYDKVGTIVAALFICVLLIEFVSSALAAIVQSRIAIKAAGKKVLAGLCFAVFVFCLAGISGPDFSHTSPAILKTMGLGLLKPNMELIRDMSQSGLLFLLAETLCIAFLGTLIGSIIAFPLGFLCAGRYSGFVISGFFKVFSSAVRCVPFLIYGLIFIRVVGPGAPAGILTLAVCSIGLMTKRFSQALEALDTRGYKALEAMGVPFFLRFRHAIMPQLWPALASAVLYRFDINVREASVLGIVGAGGIGAPLVLAMNKYNWASAGAILWGLVVIVFVVDIFSGYLRRRLKA